MVKSLKEYNPTASKFKIVHNSSVGGESNTANIPGKGQPALVKLLAHLFAFLMVLAIVEQRGA